MFGISKKILFIVCLSQLAHLILTAPTGIEFSDSEVKDTLAFWTPERIEEALSTPLIPSHIVEERKSDLTCPFTPPSLNKLIGNYSELYPWIGKLLVYRGNNTFSCSASVVQSTGSRMLASAGHCILDANSTPYERPMFILQFGPQYNISKWPINGAWWEKCFAADPTQIPNVWDYSWLRTTDPVLPFAGGGLIYPSDVPSDLVLTEYGYPGTGGGYLYGCSGTVCADDFPLSPPCTISGTDMSFSIGCEGSEFNEGMSGGPVVGGTKPNIVIAGVMSNFLGQPGFVKEYWTFLGTSARAAYNVALANGA